MKLTKSRRNARGKETFEIGLQVGVAERITVDFYVLLVPAENFRFLILWLIPSSNRSGILRLSALIELIGPKFSAM